MKLLSIKYYFNNKQSKERSIIINIFIPNKLKISNVKSSIAQYMF